MNQHEKDRWELTRRKGVAYFIFINGAVKMGGAMFLVVSVAGNFLFGRKWAIEELVSEAVV